MKKIVNLEIKNINFYELCITTIVQMQKLKESLEKKIREQEEFLEKANKPKERKTSNENKVETSTVYSTSEVHNCSVFYTLAHVSYKISRGCLFKLGALKN